jgi:hypothetical protein
LRFEPSHQLIGTLAERTEEEIKNEPMLYSCDPEFAMEAGGPITREFLAHLPMEDGWVIDSKVVMLKPGWLPAIGGWHCDAIRRPNGQPDFAATPSTDEHVLAIIGAPPAVWLHNPIDLQVEGLTNVWKELSQQIEEQVPTCGTR